MLYWITPITDRTQSDVDRRNELKAKGYENLTTAERDEWDGGLKGAMKESDFLRIENNIQLLADVFELTVTTYYTAIPYPFTQSYIDNLYNNVSTLLAQGYKYTTTPTVPSHPLTTYQKWNDIEQILLDIYTLLSANFYYYTGSEIYTGDLIGDL